MSKIKGNTVGTTTPRADYAETNPKSAAYIRNKPDLSGIAAAQKAADDAMAAAGAAQEAAENAAGAAGAAQETANAALPKSGGDMTGAISMGGNKISGLGDPTEDGDAVSKKYVADFVGAKHKIFSATVTVNDWNGAAAPYTQTIGISGILEADAPHITPVYSATLETALAQQEAWGMVSYADAGDGAITFTCLEDKPSVAVPILIEVMRS